MEWEELGLAKKVWQNGRADHVFKVVMKDSGSRWAEEKIIGGGQFKELSSQDIGLIICMLMLTSVITEVV